METSHPVKNLKKELVPSENGWPEQIKNFAIFIIDFEGNIKDFNADVEVLLGYEMKEIEEQNISILFKDKNKTAEILSSLRNKPLSIETRLIRKDQSEFNVNILFTPLANPGQETNLFLVNVQEANKDKRIENRYRLLVESAPSAMILVNKLGKIVLINSEAEKLFGYSKIELSDKEVEVLIPARFQMHHPAFRDAFYKKPEARSMGIGRDLYARRKDGTEFPVTIGLNPIDDHEGIMVLAAIIDITERKKSEERLRLVVESAPNAMVLVNGEGKITLVNSQTEKLFGYTREELIDHSLEMLIPKRFKEQHPKYRDSFFAKPAARPMGVGRELYAQRKDGSEFPVEIGLNPIEFEDGNMVLASVIDITERKLMEANKHKSDFLANMSHELRTPMNAILGFSEMLIDKKAGNLNERQLDYLNDIHASGSHLLRLINDILDLSKIESGKIEIFPETFAPTEVIEEVLKVLSPLANAKNISINTAINNNINLTADKNKFRQILYNLVSNAIKFNVQGGKISITADLISDENFLLKIADTGIGISKPNLHKLFIPFVQLDPGTNKRHEGTGLGLAVTKKIVDLHRGEITIESEPGKGTTFTVRLPLTLKQ